jgi:hypothetical protein
MEIEIPEENNNLSKQSGKKTSGLSLELGDIIRITAPTNDEMHEQTFYILYIDTSTSENITISIVNTSNLSKKQLRIINGKYVSDESITNISILARNPQRGYARQHNLLPLTWIDIHFEGEFPLVLTGQITNLEEDQIEITVYPDMDVIYIDFGYRGIPENLPIKEIVIREKPPSISNGQNLYPPSELENDSGVIFQDELEEGEIADITYTETGEAIIYIPEKSRANNTIYTTLQQVYLDNDDIFGEDLGEVILEVELPDNQKRYGIESQTNSMMDALLSDIPTHKRSTAVMENIHRLIERYKELRQLYSKFDESGNIRDILIHGPQFIPAVDKLFDYRNKVDWIIPVVSNTRRLYSDDPV